MDNGLFHECKVKVKALFERAEEADTVSELWDISSELGEFIDRTTNLYCSHQLTKEAHHSISRDTDVLVDYILRKRKEATELVMASAGSSSAVR